MSAHTPGPWTYQWEGSRFVVDADAEIGKRGIACTGGSQYANEANARLMSASPDLLQALIDVLPYAEACIGATWRANPPSDSVITSARAAIAKAVQP